MTLLWPWALLLLLLVPLLVRRYRTLLRRAEARRADLARLGLVATRPSGPRRGAAGLLLAAVVLLITALARPEASIAQPHREGTVILAVDASASMAATDLAPSRIEAARAAARTFVAGQPAAIRIGVVAFGDSGLILQQPTTDRAAVIAAVDRITVQGGTGLGLGIQAALSAIAGRTVQLDQGPSGVDGGSGSAPGATPSPGQGTADVGYYPNSAILLLSDGENTSRADPVAAAELASTAGVTVYPVGLGSPEGGVIDVDGLKLATALDEETLRRIAEVTDGRYYAAADEEELVQVYSTVDLGWVVRNERVELTAPVAALAALCLLAAAALSLRRTGRVI